MNIDFRNNNTFTSRNATIRYADDLARRVNREFPRLSASKMETLGFAKYYQPTIERLWDKNQEMRDVVEAIINSKKPIKEKLMKNKEDRLQRSINRLQSKSGNVNLAEQYQTTLDNKIYKTYNKIFQRFVSNIPLQYSNLKS